MSFIKELQESGILDRMSPISLDEMKTVRLMSRTDTKYVASERMLMPVLEKAAEFGYMVQYTTTALGGYNSVYYDTEALEMYVRHHNRILKRQKIRVRTYLDSGITFFEIKNKTNKGRTKKVRIPVENTDCKAVFDNAGAAEFLKENSRYTPEMLSPSLQTKFNRITLVNPQKTERITIDMNVEFTNFRNGTSKILEGLSIIELKKDGRYSSVMGKILQDFRIKPFKISKYCIGTVLTNPDVKANRFKRKIHLLNIIKNKQYAVT